MDILLAEWGIESIGMAKGGDIGRGSSFSQHLNDGIARYEVNEKEDNRNHHPDHWERK